LEGIHILMIVPASVFMVDKLYSISKKLVYSLRHKNLRTDGDSIMGLSGIGLENKPGVFQLFFNEVMVDVIQTIGI